MKRHKLGKAKDMTRRKSKIKSAEKHSDKKLTQLHFTLDVPVLRACLKCDLSYNKGAPDDEALHKLHCMRVQRGMEWGKEDEREQGKAGVTEVNAGVRLKDGTIGRIVSFRADATGRIGAKVRTLTL
jgi:N-acetyltransferase